MDDYFLLKSMVDYYMFYGMIEKKIENGNECKNNLQIEYEPVSRWSFPVEINGGPLYVLRNHKKKIKTGYFYTLLFHSLFKVEFYIDHFVLGEHLER